MRTRIAIVIVAAACVSFAVTAPAADAKAKLPAGCAGPTQSGLVQYCEAIPSTGGPQTPVPGLPSLGATLSRHALTELQASHTSSRSTAAARRRLLTLPGPERHLALGAASRPQVAPDWWSLGHILILILAALAIALCLAAIGRKLRQARVAQ